MRKLIFAAAVCLVAAACQTPQQSAGTATGVVAGAVVGGPVGAVVMLAGAPEAINLCEHTADYDGSALFEHACRLGLEGIVAKKKAARYRSGTCRSWVKVKNPDYERR
jgi:hypothetical protein